MALELVYIVMTEVNGYLNIYGHVVYKSVDDARQAAQEARDKGKWDEVYVLSYALT